MALAPIGSARGEVEWSPITGEFTARYMGYDEDSPRDDPNHFGEGELKLQITAKFGEKLQLVAVPLLQYDTENKTADEVEFHENEFQRPAGTFQELHLTYYGDTFELSIGKQVLAWGPAPIYRPTDNLNAADFLDVPTVHKVGVPAASLLLRGEVDVQLVVAPLFTPNRLPQADNRWTILPEDVLRQIEEVTGFEPPILLERNLPRDEIQNVQAGLRLRSSSLIDGWDLELSAFHGHDSFGLFDAALLFPPVRIEVEQIYPEYNEVGGGFSTAAGGFTIHAEAAYHRTVGSIDDDYWQYVAGFDYVIDSGIPAALDRIQFGVEYAGEGVDNENTRPISTFSTGFNRALVNSAAALVDFVFSEETSVRGGGSINFNDDDFVVRAEITHKLIENLRLRAGVEVFWSRDDLLRHLGRERPSVRVHDLLLLRRPATHHRGRRRIDRAAHWTASAAAALLAIALAAPPGRRPGSRS